MADEDLVARLRATGGPAFGRTMRKAATDTGAVGKSAGRISGRGFLAAARGARSLSTESGKALVSLRSLAAGAAAYKVAGAIGAAVSQGFDYNRMIDSQNVAFTTLLGSQKKSADFMAQIQALALKSPVLDPESTGDAARLLMAYGVNAKKTLPLVEALGDMSAATGKSIAETMPRGALALGQIAGKGKLQAEELNQLAESVGLSRDAIRKQLHMTRDEFADAFKPGGKQIVSAKALPAILEAMRKQSGGAAERLSKTSAGKMDRLREVFKKAMGGLTRDLYVARGNIAGRLASIIQDKDLNFGEKIAAARREVVKELGPLAQDFKSWWEREHVGQVIGDEVRKDAPKVGKALGDAVHAASPVVAQAAAAIAPVAAGAFVDAFKAAPAWAKVLTVALIAKKLGVFSTLGRLAAGRMCGSIGSRLPGCIEGKMAGKGASTVLGRVGALMGTTLGLAAGITFAAAIAAAYDKLNPELPTGPKKPHIGPVPLPGPTGRPRHSKAADVGADIAHHIGLGPKEPKDPGKSKGGAGGGNFGPGPIVPITPKSIAPHAARGGARAVGAGGGSLLHLEVPVQIGRRELGRASAKIAADDLRSP